MRTPRSLEDLKQELYAGAYDPVAWFNIVDNKGLSLSTGAEFSLNFFDATGGLVYAKLGIETSAAAVASLYAIAVGGSGTMPSNFVWSGTGMTPADWAKVTACSITLTAGTGNWVSYPLLSTNLQGAPTLGPTETLLKTVATGDDVGIHSSTSLV